MTRGTSYTFENLTNDVEYVVEILSFGPYLDDRKWVARSGTPRATLEVDPSSLSVAEGGAGKTYRVRMRFRPDAQVTVTPVSGDTTAVAVTPVQMDFPPADWNKWQTVTVTAPEDDDATDETVTIAHDVSGGYGRSTAAVTVAVDDNDTARVVVEPLTLQVAEGGAATYRVKLATEPEAQVTVTAASGDPTAATAAPATLTFVAADWNRWQTVTVTGVDDYDADDETVTISHAVAGYGTVTAADPVTVRLDDYGEPGLTLDPDALAITEGGSGTYTVVLDSPPAGNVTVRVSPGGPGNSDLRQEVAAVVPGVNCCSSSTPPVVNAKTLTFTPGNWRVAQTVTVTGVENFDVQDLATEIVHSVSPGYGSRLIERLAVTVANNDRPGATVSPAALTVREGETADYEVRSHTYPGYGKVDGNTVTLQAKVTAQSSDPDAASVAIGRLKGLPGTGDDPPPPLVFTVTAAEDDDADNGTVTITHAYETTYRDPQSSNDVPYGDAPAVAVASLTVTVLDPDVAPPTDLRVAPGNGRLTASWKAPVYTGYLPVLRYTVSWRWKTFRPPAYSDLGWDEKTVSAEHTTFVIKDLGENPLENGTTYEVRVRAENEHDESDWTGPVDGTPGRIGWVEFTRTDLEVREGDIAHLAVRRTLNPGEDLSELSRELAVPWEIMKGSADAADYTYTFLGLLSSYGIYDEIVFGSGEASATISVPTVSDDEDEGDEDFWVHLRDPDVSSGFGIRDATARVVIKERGTPVVQFAAARVRHDETDADGVVSLTVNVDPPLAQDLTRGGHGDGQCRRRRRHRRGRHRLHRAAGRVDAAGRRRQRDPRRADRRRPRHRGGRDVHRDPDRGGGRAVHRGRHRRRGGDHRRRRPRRAGAGDRRGERGRGAGRGVLAERHAEERRRRGPDPAGAAGGDGHPDVHDRRGEGCRGGPDRPRGQDPDHRQGGIERRGRVRHRRRHRRRAGREPDLQAHGDHSRRRDPGQQHRGDGHHPGR